MDLLPGAAAVKRIHNEPRMSLRVVTTLEELHALREAWTRLLMDTTSHDIFLTWEWLFTWSKHYLGRNDLRVILVYKGESQLVAIAPLYIGRARSYGGLTLRELKFLGTEEACSCYLDVIVSERHKKAALNRIYRFLHGEAEREWDILTLAQIPAESSSIDFWADVVQEDGRLIEITTASSSPIIDLPGHCEEFYARFNNKQRAELKRCRELLRRGGAVTFYRACLPEEVEREMDAFVRLHQMRWEQKGSGGVFRSERFLRFHREISQVFSQKGWVRLDFLLLNGERIAASCGYKYEGTTSGYLPGLNPTIAQRTSSGTQLLFQCIEHAILEGCQRFDLLAGMAAYKMSVADRLRRCLTLRHYNRRVLAAGLKLLESTKQTAKVLLR